MWILAGLIIGALLDNTIGAVAGLALGVALELTVGKRGKQASPPDLLARLESIEARLAAVEYRLSQNEPTTGPVPLPAVEAPAEASPAMAGTAPAAQAAALAGVRMPAPALADVDITAPASLAEAARTGQVSPQPADTTQADLPPDQLTPKARWWERLFAGNLVAKVGVIVLFFGVGFLLKYAYDHALLPPESRLLGVAAIAASLLWLGHRWLGERRTYALILQGGGVGLAYLDVYFALKQFELISPTLAFAGFALLGGIAIALALRQDAQALAQLGLSGAFLAPLLAASGGEHHVLLFSYYALINSLIVLLCWFKPWRALCLTGFWFTFAVSVAWGVFSYQPEQFASTEPFLVYYFLLYTALPLLLASRQPPSLRGLVDGTLVFGAPLACTLLQWSLAQPAADRVMTWSALLVALLYATLGLRCRRNWPVLAEAYGVLAVLFATLAPFFAFEVYPTFAIWTLEGAALVWLGHRQQRPLARFFGMALALGASLYFLLGDTPRGGPPLDAVNLGYGLIAVSALLIARLERWRGTDPGATLWLGWGVLWWLTAGYDLVSRVAHEPWQQAPWLLLFVTASAVLADWRGARLTWPALRLTALLLVPAILLHLLWLADSDAHPLQGWGWLSWPAAFATAGHIVRRQLHKQDSVIVAALLPALLWLAIGAASWELDWRTADNGWVHLWHDVATSLPALLAAIWLAGRQRKPGSAWLVQPIYLQATFAMVWAWLGLRALWQLGLASTELAPLPLYLPLLNPVDLIQAAMLGAAWAALDSTPKVRSVASPVLAVLAFLSLNALALRCIHHWLGVPYDIASLLDSVETQTLLSLLWTSTALGLMRSAIRLSQRPPWYAGAGLLALVVGKLFVNDLASSGMIARIVSFLGVGILLLVIGYLAPMPPGDSHPENE